MIHVQAKSAHFEVSRHFKTQRGIKTYLLKLRRLHRAHIAHPRMGDTTLKISIDHIG